MGMMDQTLVGKLLANLYQATATSTWAPAGGSSITITPPYRLHLMTAVGTEAAAGTELTTGAGYTSGFNATGGSSLGTVFAGTITAATFSNLNVVSWSATGSWTTVTAIEIYDSATTAVRHLWGTLTANISGVANGDTVQFAAASISANASNW